VRERGPVEKVTNLLAGMALGATEQLPEAERHLNHEAHLTDSLAVRLSGRAAELVVSGQGSTRAANDLSGATELATRMVTEFGPFAGSRPDRLPGRQGGLPARRFGRRTTPVLAGTQRTVDKEVARLLRKRRAAR